MIEVNGNQIPWEEGMTIRRVLEKCDYTYPMIAVRVNGEPVKKDEYDTYQVEDGDEVQVIHIMGGG